MALKDFIQLYSDPVGITDIIRFPNGQVKDIKVRAIKQTSTANESGVAKESDPVFMASASAGIQSGNIENWNTAFSWGNHAVYGYIKQADNGVYKNGDKLYLGGILIENTKIEDPTNTLKLTYKGITVLQEKHSDTHPPYFSFVRATANHQFPAVNQYLGVWGASGYAGGIDIGDSASIIFQAAENFSNLARGARINFSTTLNGTVNLRKVFSILETGDLELPYYENTRNDGLTAKALYVSNGIVKYGTISGLGNETLDTVTARGNQTDNELYVNTMWMWDNPNSSYWKIECQDDTLSFSTMTGTYQNIGIWHFGNLQFGTGANNMARGNHSHGTGTLNYLQKQGATGLINSMAYELSGKIYISGQLNSTLVTGTAPLAVNSTTLNTNLNADMVDGLHSSAFAVSAHTHNLQAVCNAGNATSADIRANGFWAQNGSYSSGSGGYLGLNSAQAILSCDGDGFSRIEVNYSQHLFLPNGEEYADNFYIMDQYALYPNTADLTLGMSSNPWGNVFANQVCSAGPVLAGYGSYGAYMGNGGMLGGGATNEGGLYRMANNHMIAVAVEYNGNESFYYAGGYIRFDMAGTRLTLQGTVNISGCTAGQWLALDAGKNLVSMPTPLTSADQFWLRDSGTGVLSAKTVTDRLFISTTTTSAAISGIGTQSSGLYGSSTNSTGISGYSSNTMGITGTSGTQAGGHFITQVSTTSDIKEVLRLTRQPSSGSAQAGLGGYLSFFNQIPAGSTYPSGYFVNKWTTITAGSETSAFEWWLRNAGGQPAKVMGLDGAGNLETKRGQYHYMRQSFTADTAGDWRFYSDANAFYIQYYDGSTWTTKSTVPR